MADFFKDSIEAGREVRSRGQGSTEDRFGPYKIQQDQIAEGMNIGGEPKYGISKPAEAPKTSGRSLDEIIADVDKVYFKEPEPGQAPAPAPEDATYMGDLGRGVVKGVAGLVGGVYELGNLATMGGLDTATKKAFGTSGTEAFNNARTALNKQDSAAVQAQRAELEAADGFWNSMGVVLSNPKLMGAMAIEMVPQMATVLTAAKTVATKTLASQIAKGATKEVAEKSAQKAATLTVMGVNPALEAGMAASDVRSTVMQLAEADLQSSPQYQALVAQGYSFEDARARLANDAATFAAAVTAPISLASNALTAGFEARLATGQVGKHFGLKALGKEVGEGLIKEPIQEGIEEGGSQFGQNVGLKYSGAKPNQDLLEGVPQAAGAGAALGVVAGAGFGAANARFGLSKDPNAAVNPPAGGDVAGSTDAGTTPPGGAASVDAGGAGEATAAERPVGLTLTDSEFGAILQSPQAVPFLTHLWANSDEKTQTRIQEIARRNNLMVNLSETAQDPKILEAGAQAIADSGDQIVNAFLNKTATELEKTDVTPLPPAPATVDDLMNQEASINQEYDPTDAAIDSAEAIGIKPKQGAVVETPNAPGGTANTAAVPPTDQAVAPTESVPANVASSVTNATNSVSNATGFAAFRNDLVQNAQDKGVAVKDTDYVEVPVPQEIKAIGDALGVPIFGYRYVGKSKKLQMLKGISSANGIGINANAKATHLNVLGHEVYHELAKRDPAAAAQLNGLIQQYLSEEGKQKYAAWLKETSYDPAKFDEEMAADVLGVLFTDSEFWSMVNAQNQTLVEKILSVISDLISKLKANVNRQEMYTKRGRAMQSFITDYDAVRKMLAQFVADAAKKPKVGQTTQPNRQLKDGSQITIERTVNPNAFSNMVRMEFGQPWTLVAKNSEGQEIGRLTYMEGGGPIDVSVRPQDRRRGVATALYDELELLGGKIPAEESGVAISDDARAFRAARASKAKTSSIDSMAEIPETVERPDGTVLLRADTKNPPSLTQEQEQRRKELFDRAVQADLARTIDRSQLAQIDKILGYGEGNIQPQPAKFDLVEEILAGPEAKMQENRARTAEQNVTDEQLQTVRQERARQAGFTEDQRVMERWRQDIDARRPYEGEVEPFDINKRPAKKEEKPYVSKTEFKKKTPEPQQELPIGDNPGRQKPLARFAAKASKILNEMYSPSKAQEHIEDLEAILRSFGAGRLADVKRSDAEYIFSQFGQAGALSDAERDELRRGDIRTEMQTNLKRKIDELKSKDLNDRATALRTNIRFVAEDLAALRQEMTRAGMTEQEINSVLLDKEVGVEALIQGFDMAEGKEVSALSEMMQANGADAASVRFAAEQRAIDLGRFNQTLNQLSKQLADAGVPADQVQRTMATVAEAAQDINEPTGVQGELFGDKATAAAQLVDALIGVDGGFLIRRVGDTIYYMEFMTQPEVNNPRALAALMKEAKYAKIGMLDILNELRLRNIQLKAPIEAAIQRPGILYGLEYWLKKPENQGRNAFVLRQEWLSSLEAGLKDVEGFPAAENAIMRDLSEGERLIFEQWKKDISAMRDRLKQAKRRDTQERYVHTSLETAFPNALFNKYTLSQMRDTSKLSEEDTAILRYLTSDTDKSLADVWLEDLNYAWEARRDLRDQMTDVLSEAEMKTFMDWRKAHVRDEAPVALATMRSNAANLVLSQRSYIDPSAMSDALTRIFVANENELLPIVQSAYELVEAAKADNSVEARDATLDAIEAQDAESINSDVTLNEDEESLLEGEEDVDADENEEGDENVGDLSLFTSDTMPIPGSKVVVEPEVGDANADPAKIYEQLRLRGVRNKRGAHSGVVYASVIADHINAIVSKWKSRPEFQVVENIAQLPKALRDAILAKSGGMLTKGAISPDGKVYLFSDAMENLEDAEFTFFHEVYGHRGLRAFLGDKLNAFLETQYKTNKRVREAADKLIAKAKELGRGMTTIEATEEAIADLAVTNQEPSLFIKILQSLKKFLRSIGMDSVAKWMDEKSYRDLAYVLSEAKKAVREGRPGPLDGAPSEVRLNANKNAVEIFATKNGKTTVYALFNALTNNWTVFYNDNGLAPGDFGIQTFENYADALKLARQHGKVVSSKDHPLRVNKAPSSFNKISITNPSDVTGMKAWMRKAKIYIFKKYLPVYEVVDQIRKQGGETNLLETLILYRGKIKPFFDRFRREFLRPIAAALNTIEKNGDSLEFHGETYTGSQLVGLYLNALHASERNAAVKNVDPSNDKGSGMSDDEAEMILRKAQDLPSITEIKDISAKMQRMSKIKISYMLSTGLISEQQAIALSQYMFYVNLSGNKTDGKSGEMVDRKVLGNSAITLNSNDTKRALGRESLAVDVLENTMNAYLAAIVHGQANVVKQSVVTMVNNVNDPKFAAINPFKFAKVLNMERLITDKNILKTVGGDGTANTGMKLMRRMKVELETGMRSADEIATDLYKRLQEAHEQGKINSAQLSAFSQSIQNAIDNGLKGSNYLSPDGYVSYTEENNKYDKDNVIVAKFGGKPVVAEFFEGVDDGDRFGTFMTALRGDLTPPDSPVGEFVGKWNRIVGQLITSRNLAWVPVNWMRDIGAAYFNAAADPRVGKVLAKKMMKNATRSYSIAMKNLINEDYVDKNGPVYSFIKKFFKKPVSADEQRLWAEFKNSGAEVFFMDRKDMKEQIAEMQKEIDPNTGLLGTWDAYAKFTDFLGMPAEASARFSAYRTLREAGWSVQDAATYAKEITVNFEQTGALRSLRTWFMFANPSIQGTARMFRDSYKMVNGVPVPTPQMLKIVGALAGMGFVMGFVARAIGDNGDDEVNDLDQIPRYKRATSVVIAPAVPLGAPLPLPYGWNVFYAMGNFAADSMFGKTPVTQTASRIATSAVDAFWPLGQSESAGVFGAALKMFVPTPASPILDIAMNESRYGGPIAKGDNPFVRAQESNAYSNFSSASPVSVFVARTLNELGGGNQYRSGALFGMRNASDQPIISLDLNPAWLDYLGASYLPGPITDVARGVNLGINTAMGKDIKNPPYPLIDRFSTRISDGWDRGAYERSISFVDTKYKEAQTMPQAKREAILAQYPDLGGAKGALGTIDTTIRQMRSNLRMVENSDEFSSKEKIEYRNQVEAREKQLYKQAVSIAIKTGFGNQVLADQ